MVSSVLPGGEPFFYASPGSHISCLLLHGFTATPQEMRRLGQFLHGCGFAVSCPLLAGHGTDVRDLQATTWQDWYRSTHEAWSSLRGSCDSIFAIGLSLGGVLALNLESEVQLAGVVTMATPMMLDRRLLWATRVLKHALCYRKKGPSHLLDAQALAARVAYDHTPTRGLEQALLLFQHVYRTLPQVQAPVLLFHSRYDKTVDPACMPRIYERVGSTDKHMEWLENSGHIIPEDRERLLVYAKIRRWILDHAQPA